MLLCAQREWERESHITCESKAYPIHRLFICMVLASFSRRTHQLEGLKRIDIVLPRSYRERGNADEVENIWKICVNSDETLSWFQEYDFTFYNLELMTNFNKKNKETDKENLFIMLYWKYELVNCVGFNGFCLGVAVSIHFDQIIKNGL